uniref:Uncharacterized protein n=1 Tax=Plectus sambesii TaxID=2011161 RepID=A0A914W7Q3_9BILA
MERCGTNSDRTGGGVLRGGWDSRLKGAARPFFLTISGDKGSLIWIICATRTIGTSVAAGADSRYLSRADELQRTVARGLVATDVGRIPDRFDLAASPTSAAPQPDPGQRASQAAVFCLQADGWRWPEVESSASVDDFQVGHSADVPGRSVV